MKHWIVEDIKSDFVRLETPEETIVTIARNQLPITLKAGDWLVQTAEGYAVDIHQTAQRRAEIIGRTNRLFDRKPRS